MNIQKITRSLFRRIPLYGMSIQHRLPLLICFLLATVIFTYGIVSYYTVKQVSMDMGKKRLHAITDQLASMFTQSTKALNTATIAVAAKDPIKKYVQTGAGEFKSEALEILNKLKKDSTWLLVELLNADKIPVLWSGNKAVESKLSLDTIFSSLSVDADSSRSGKIYAAGDSMYYPVMAIITNQKQVIGYLVVWRSFSTSPKGLERLSQLVGTGARFYIGNTDGSLWTNLIKPVAARPIDTARIQNTFEYSNNGEKTIAAAQHITNSKWWVLVEFPEKIIVEAASGVLYRIMIIGSVLFVIGFIITWFMSRNIIKPLTKLTAAATAIAAGDHSFMVKVDRTDELGKLTDAFNSMAEQIHITKSELENKVVARTSQLQAANKEMESFTYSVSHDLRAPLRIINGYSEIIKEDSQSILSGETKRMLENITINAKKMGDLIDNLLNFSRLGRRVLTTYNTDMNAIVKPILEQQLIGIGNYNVKLKDLNQCKCDSTLIKQVWENLISNAVKYSSKNPNPVIEIGSLKENNKIVYYIKDNGAGFDMKYYHKLFGVFQRLHKETEFEGTGVGLALTQRIISKHEGRIWAESAINEGSTFYFTICKS
ncbi:MAG TPA: ATP-binding protein [Chitinophagaceae bacterium]|nr:ATP-binding protein [Chitinophagaceae bacterium]